jgi:PAS domain S-box-containing protein
VTEAPSADWFRALIDAAPDIYFRYSFHPHRRFAYVSPAIQAATGYTAEDFQSDSGLCLRLMSREDRPLFRQIARARRPLTGRIGLKHLDGTSVRLELNTVPVARSGRLLAVEGVARVVLVSYVGPTLPYVGPTFRSGNTFDATAEPVQQRLSALMYEVHALLHRMLPPGAARPESVLHLGGIVLDLQRMAVTMGGQAVALTSRELMVLKYFLERPGRLVTREQLLKEVWTTPTRATRARWTSTSRASAGSCRPFTQRRCRLYEYEMSSDERSLYDDVTEYLLQPSLPEQFQLYRVFRFGERPRLYRLPDPLSASCHLNPVQFRAFVRSSE